MKVTDCITCPKCHKNMLKNGYKSPSSFSTWFCHGCRTFFTTEELVHQWGLDAGDLCSNGKPTIILVQKSRKPTPYYSEFDGGEPHWASRVERDEAYEVVVNMYAGVDDYLDLIATQECALDIGVQ